MKPRSMWMLTWTSSLLACAGCASQVSDARTQAVAARLSRGQALIEQADYKQALAQCQAGIDELGGDYARAPICNAAGRPLILLDDTAQHLILAGILQREGQLDGAARSACSALHSRISIARTAANGCR
ncbi:MAG: hypothetical protein JNL93_13680 [Pelomonas sp.]|nr:hypothetical protein [Roseateles sp.]